MCDNSTDPLTATAITALQGHKEQLTISCTSITSPSSPVTKGITIEGVRTCVCGVCKFDCVSVLA